MAALDQQTYRLQGLPNSRTKLVLEAEIKTSLGETHPSVCDNRKSKLGFQF